MSRDNYYNGRYCELSRSELLDETARAIRETDTVADIGCGIMPMKYFRPKLHLMIEPWGEYSNILSDRYRNDKSVVVLRCGALEALRALGDHSVDSIFMLDVIEHMEKNEGRQVLAECERVAREQIIVFTPFGFMPQHVEEGEKDAWGLSGGIVQEHRSGWLPEDFGDDWSFYVCKDFHTVDSNGETFDEPYGAFFALRNFNITDAIPSSGNLADLQRSSLVELENKRLLLELQTLSSSAQHQSYELDELQRQKKELEINLESTQAAYRQLVNSRGVRLYLGFRHRLSKIVPFR